MGSSVSKGFVVQEDKIMTEMMKAAMVTGDGVKIQQAPRPVPGPEQVLVRVRAAGLNRADLGVAAGVLCRQRP